MNGSPHRESCVRTTLQNRCLFCIMSDQTYSFGRRIVYAVVDWLGSPLCEIRLGSEAGRSPSPPTLLSLRHCLPESIGRSGRRSRCNPPYPEAGCLASASWPPRRPPPPQIRALTIGGWWVGRTLLPPARPLAAPSCARADLTRVTVRSRSP
eukprot:5202946-Pleurochrysis_carterae.AAC.1